MSSTSDALLRFMGYLIIIIMVIVVGIIGYLAYFFMFGGGTMNPDTAPDTRVIMDQNLNTDLNQKNQLDANNIFIPNNATNTTTPGRVITPEYKSPESQIPSYSTYNPFEDDSLPITDPDDSSTKSASNPIGNISSQPSNEAEKSSRPMDPTNRSQQPNLDLLF